MVSKKLSELKVSEIKVELEKRNESKVGKKETLVKRLEECLKREGKNPEDVMFDIEDEDEEEPKLQEMLQIMMQNITRKFDEQKNSLEARLDEQKEALTEQKNSLETRLEEQKEALTEQKNSLEGRLDEQKKSLETRLENILEVRLEEQKKSIEVRLDEQKNAFEEQKNYLEARLDAQKEEQQQMVQKVSEQVDALDERQKVLEDKIVQITQQMENVRVRVVRGQANYDHGAGVRMQPPVFDGQISWSIFKQQFEAAAESNGWTEEEKATALVLALRGPAAELLQTITKSQQRDYAALMQAVTMRFGDEHMQEVYRTQLRNRKQRRGETLQQLQSDIQRLAHLSWGNQNADFMESITCDAFINAILDEELKQALRLSGKKTAAELLAFALTYESAKSASRNIVQVREVMAHEECTCNKVQSFAKKGTLRCWNCGTAGHIQRDCRKRKRLDSSEISKETEKVNVCPHCSGDISQPHKSEN